MFAFEVSDVACSTTALNPVAVVIAVEPDTVPPPVILTASRTALVALASVGPAVPANRVASIVMTAAPAPADIFTVPNDESPNVELPPGPIRSSVPVPLTSVWSRMPLPDWKDRPAVPPVLFDAWTTTVFPFRVAVAVSASIDMLRTVPVPPFSLFMFQTLLDQNARTRS